MANIKFDKYLRFNIDSEFFPKNKTVQGFTNKKSSYYQTSALTIQVRQDNIPVGKGNIYSHVDSHIEAKRHYPEFKQDLVLFDYLKDTNQAELMNNATTNRRTKKVLLDSFFFYSPKDIQYSIKEKISYELKEILIRNLLISCFSKTRRIMTKVIRGNGYYGNEIPTDYVLKIDGELYKVYLTFTDVSGLTNTGLKGTSETYLGSMEFKDNLSDAQKSDLISANILGTPLFEDYALGDLVMTDIFDASITLENEIRTELNLPIITAKQKKLTVGAMSARLLRDYIRAYLHQDKEGEELQINEYSVYTSPKNIQKYLSQFRKNKEIEKLPFLPMVDGGRCVRELSKRPGFYNLLSYTIHPCLIDIDIDGCYGNGLKNQIYAVGNPTIDVNEMSLREMIKKYGNNLVNGLWQCRLFGKLGDFLQDAFISKTNDSVRNYVKRLTDVSYENSDYKESLEGALTANMCCLTNELHGALCTSDFLELILEYTAKDEKNYWLDEIKVIGFMGYLKTDEVTNFDEMLSGYATTSKEKNRTVSSYYNFWIRIPLNEYATKLLAIRKKYPKKTPMNEFCKLVINSSYGVICSEYFDTDDTGISNVIVANNITARARVLAFCMAKALGTAMIITDGGVFDVNSVNHLTKNRKKVTLTSLAKLTDDIYSDASRQKVYEQKPLLDYEVNLLDYADKNKVDDLKSLIKSIDKKAWEHCSNMFSDLTIFKEKQFIFESKNVYDTLILHNKSDYILNNSLFTYGTNKFTEQLEIKLEPYKLHRQRGTKGELPFKESEILYEAVKTGEATKIKITQETLIGLSEYQKPFAILKPLDEEDLFGEDDEDYTPEYMNTLANRFIEFNIYPGDVKESIRTLYSHIPTCMKHKTLNDYQKSLEVYDEMKNTENPELGLYRMKTLNWI